RSEPQSPQVRYDKARETRRKHPRALGNGGGKGKEGDMDKQTPFASNVGNVLLALEQEPALMNAFDYDEMVRTEVLLRPRFSDDPTFKSRPVTDADVTAVQSHLQWLGFRELGKNTAHEAVDKHAREHSFHPVRDYLNALQWDGTERVGTWLAD